jgi:hypothetical protein
MPSDKISKKTALTVIGVFVVAVLLWGYFIAQQILLSVFISTFAALLGGLIYVAWQYFGVRAAIAMIIYRLEPPVLLCRS